MLHVLLDARIDVGGIRRYHSLLDQGLKTDPAVRVTVWRRGAPFTPWGRWRLALEAKRQRPDVIHGTHLEIPPLRSAPRLVTVHDTIPLSHPASMPSAARRLIFARLIERAKRAEAVIAPSQITADALVQEGFRVDSIHVVPLAVPTTFSPIEEEERFEAQRRFGGGRPYLSVVADRKSHKNLDYLFRELADLCRDRGMVIAVRGSRLGALPDVVRCVPPLTDQELALFYGGSELHAMPSLVEGFGLPVLEAAACGVPVVCGRDVGVVAHLGAGLLIVDVGAEGDLRRGCELLLGDPIGAGERGKRLAQLARTLTVEKMTSETVAIYEDVVSP